MDQAGRQDFAMPEADEARFIRAAQRGDREAYLALARWHWPPVSAVIHGLTPADRTGPRTLDVFEHGWRGIHYLPEGQRFHAWIHRIALNLCQSAPSSTAASDSISTESTAEVAAQIESCFSRLSVEHRQSLALALGCGLNPDDIARVNEITPRAAAERLSEARAALYSARSGWLPTTGLRHFSLSQLCNFVGTEPAGAPTFVREHLGECADCRSVLTALESQDRILTRRLGGGVDLEEIQRSMTELEQRLETVSREPRGRPAPAAKDLSAREAIPVASPVSAPIAGDETSNRRPRIQNVVPALAGLALVVVVLLAVQLGPSIQPWLTRAGIRWGPPGRPQPATQVAGADRVIPRDWATAETSGKALVDTPATNRSRDTLGAVTKNAPVELVTRTTSPLAKERSTGIASPRRSPARRESPTGAPSESTARAGGARASYRQLLCGQVVDRDGRPIAGAEVAVGVEIVLFTDRTGRFCVAAWAGDHRLSISKAGFAPLRQSVNVGARSAELTWTLEPAPAP